MAQPTERAELVTTWRALTGRESRTGWRTISIVRGASYEVLAGRRFPSNEEAVLFGFKGIRSPPIEELPNGRGFGVTPAELDDQFSTFAWIALYRQPAGSLELFATIAEDVVSTLVRHAGSSAETFYKLFLARIKAWQDFMLRGHPAILSPEAEVGLFGEILMLGTVIETGIPAGVAICAWKGPLDGLQDFLFASGAIEVKTSISVAGFTAKINCLNQLDSSSVSPLYLGAIKLRTSPDGITLPDLVTRSRSMIKDDEFAAAHFELLLLHAGYVEKNSACYTRRFANRGINLFEVTDSFPRLTHRNVPAGVISAKYEIDLDTISSESVQVKTALRHLGVFE
jgi:hypothetical protein